MPILPRCRPRSTPPSRMSSPPRMRRASTARARVQISSPVLSQTLSRRAGRRSASSSSLRRQMSWASKLNRRATSCRVTLSTKRVAIGGARAIDLAHDAALQLHAPHLQLERSTRQRRDAPLEQLGGAGSPRRVGVRRRRVPPGRRLHHFEDPRIREHGESFDAREIRRQHVRQNAADALRIRQHRPRE